MSGQDAEDTARQLAEAIRSHGAIDFVTEVRVKGHNDFPESLTLHCTGLGPSGIAAIDVTASDCVTGIFKRRLGTQELISIRHDAGMEDFSWQNFLTLFFAALRSEQGCSCEAQSAVFGSRSVFLSLHFRLQAATLSSRLELLAHARSPGPELVTRPYLAELRKFLLCGMKAAQSQRSAADASRSGDAGTEASLADHPSRVATQLLQASGAEAPLAGATLSRAAAALTVSSTPAIPSTSQVRPPIAPARPPATPRKRQGGLLVTPGGTKAKVSNPFRLGS